MRLRIGEALKRVSPLSYFDNHPSGEILGTHNRAVICGDPRYAHSERNGNGYITAAAMMAFLAFMDLRACILALAAIAVATVVLELMFKNSALCHPRRSARETMAQA